MTALPDWMNLPPEGLTVADYEALPEELCRRIEIVDGAIIVSPAPRRPHQILARKLANRLEEAAGTAFEVATDVDLRLRDVPLLNRRPDIVVYRAGLPADAVLRAEHCLLVVEVMSRGSVTTDQLDKPAEYAAAGIEHYWRIEGEPGTGSPVRAFRYRLNPTTHVYVSAGTDTGQLAVTDPVELKLDLETLR